MARTTSALVVREVKGTFRLEDIAVNAIQDHEALVEIHATGVCHTDIKCSEGKLPMKPPAILGHEGAGVVLEVGNRITKVKPGDKVLLSYSYCGECTECTSGDYCYCEKILGLNFGGQRPDGTNALKLPDGSELRDHFFGQSSFSRLAVVNGASLVKVPEDTPLETFAPLGCGVQTGAGAIFNTLNVQSEHTVAVFGAGSVGLSAIMACKIRQAKTIIAVDVQSSRLELARELGATAVVNSTEVEDVVQEICRINGGRGVKRAVDCSGVPKVVETMVDSLGTRGRACSVGGPPPGTRAGIDVFAHLLNGREYVGCHQGESNSQEMAEFLIDQHGRGNFPLEKIITHYKIQDYERAFEDIKVGNAIKAVFVWQ